MLKTPSVYRLYMVAKTLGIQENPEFENLGKKNLERYT